MFSKRISTILGAIALCLSASAQLAQLEPTSLEQTSAPSTGDKNFALVEIQFESPIEGAKVVRDNFGMADTSKPSHPGVLYAKVRGYHGQSKPLTIIHPDFSACVIDFASLGNPQELTPGMSYKVSIGVPASDYVKANRAFANLEFPKASELYQAYLASGNHKYASAARARLSLIESLTVPLEYIAQHDGATDTPTKVRLLKAAEMLADRTGSVKAHKLYNDMLAKMKRRATYDDEPVTQLHVDSVWCNPADVQARTDKTLPRDENNNGYISWVLIDLPMENVSAFANNTYRNDTIRDGKVLMYLNPGKADIISISQPDCETLSVNLADYGINEIGRGNVYNIKIQAPPAELIEADRAFASLDFALAQSLYVDMLQNYDRYDDETTTAVSDLLFTVNHIVDKDYRGTWKRLTGFFARRPTASREELAAKADSLSVMAEMLDKFGVPGMARNAQNYAKRASEYRNSVHLDLNVGQMNKYKEIILSQGLPKPFATKTLRLTYRVPGYNYPITQKVYAATAGQFSVYIPSEASAWLTSHPGKKMEIEVRNATTGKEYKLSAGKDSKLFVSLDHGDRSVEAQIFIEVKQK